MKKILLAITGLLSIGVATNSTAQITKLQDYQNNTSATIGTSKGITFREAGFSGLYPIPGTNGKEFWTCSDRGVNVDCGSANLSGCRPTYDKMYSFPAYSPKIHRIRINGDSIQILRTITVKRPNGTGATGIINPTGLGSSATEVASTDTVLDCANFLLKTTAKDTFGIDCEGIVVDKDGNFWLCEEGGPTVWKLNQNGVVIKRYTPYATFGGAQAVDAAIDTVFKYRKNNRGFEGIALAPNGKIYAIIQSPILYPTQSIGENTRIHRILEIDPTTNAMRMLAYLNDGIIGSSGADQIRLRDWKIGDMAAINDSMFLVIEAAARGVTDIKRMYMININGATAVNSGLYSGVTLEALVDSTGLANNGIKAVKKTLVMDMLSNGLWPAAYDKAEGLAILNDSTIAVCNDNDYGQTCPLADGIPLPTTTLSHLVTFKLLGSNKLPNYKFTNTTLTQGRSALSSSKDPYLTPYAPGVAFTSILTAGDKVGAYTMCGLPDGAGAFDNGNGTFTMLVNHEIGNTLGVTRAHGSIGAFVSKWVINKSDLSVVSGSDLMKRAYLWNPLTSSYILYNSSFPSTSAAFSRFCSGDLPPVSAFYNSNTGLGTQERIFMNGEENGTEGRAVAHVITGSDSGSSYELPYLGKFSWENSVASGASGDKTVVVGTDDATPGQVYVYVGSKTNSGNTIEKAGLTGGKLYGVAVGGLLTETSSSVPTPNTVFTMADLGQVQNMTGATLNTLSNTKGVTTFLRPEDAAWDPSNPSDLYFVTTNGFGASTNPSRMWRLRFTNIAQPELGGTITAVLDGTEGQEMMDNMGFDSYGHAFMQEDVGNQTHNGKIWQYTTATDQLVQIARHDSTRFLNIPGVANYLTQDEEASGIFDAQAILGPGMFLLVDQAHYGISGEVVEGGQLLAMFNPDSYNSNPEITVTGNSLSIPDGTTTTSTANNTDFGNTFTGTPVTKTFVIQNQGPGVLAINNLSITGAAKTQYSILNPPTLPLNINASSTTTITVQYNPGFAGTHNATVNIGSNDFDESLYDFAITGSAASTPEIDVTGNNITIIDGDITAGPANNTDFGTVLKNATQTRSFSIVNKGFGLLTVSNISFTGTNATEYTLFNAPTFPLSIPSSGSQTITVQFKPTADGVRNATINIANNDADEATYDFAVQGIGLPTTGIDPMSTSSFAKLYPNPTSNDVTVELSLTKDEKVTVSVYDVQGKEVLQAIERNLSIGEQTIHINTSELVNGIYFVKVTAGSVSTKMKLAIAH
jgi:hypothetical protein